MKADTYRGALDRVAGRLVVCSPTSYAAEKFVRDQSRIDLTARGFRTSRDDFEAWASGRGDCRYDPRVRTGSNTCPFTGGDWWFLDRNAERLEGNQRMARLLSACTD